MSSGLHVGAIVSAVWCSPQLAATLHRPSYCTALATSWQPWRSSASSRGSRCGLHCLLHCAEQGQDVVQTRNMKWVLSPADFHRPRLAAVPVAAAQCRWHRPEPADPANPGMSHRSGRRSKSHQHPDGCSSSGRYQVRVRLKLVKGLAPWRGFEAGAVRRGDCAAGTAAHRAVRRCPRPYWRRTVPHPQQFAAAGR